jgi:hypothetical protein
MILKNALIENSSILFADDTTLTYSNSNLAFLTKTINDEMLALSNWLDSNKLTLNTAKTNFFLFHNRIPPRNSLSITIKNTTIHQTTSAKILGVIVVDKLTWKVHIHCLNKKLTSVLCLIQNP